MIRQIKRSAAILLTFLKHWGILRGSGIQIKSSNVSHVDVQVFDHVFIKDSTIESQSSIHRFSTITNSSIRGNKIGKNCSIGNSDIGMYSYIADYSMVNNTTIGKFCSIGPGFKCGLGSHPNNFISSSPFFYDKLNDTSTSIYTEYENILIGNDVWVGANVFIKDGVQVGDGAILAAGSVILKDVPDYAIVGGVPAKIIRKRHSDDIISMLKELAWWNKDISWLKANRKFFQKSILSLEDISGLPN